MILMGLMSGTSVDGIDAAIVNISGDPPNLVVKQRGFLTVPYSHEMRDALLSATERESHAGKLCAAHVALGQMFASAAQLCAQQTDIKLSEIDAICCHGHTFWHQPNEVMFGGMSIRGTLQLGDAATIATLTGLPVVYDFRSADMAAGGQGAPLVPFADWALFHNPDENRAIQNIGGISNVTYLPASGDKSSVIAFDTGPGNMLIDLAAQHVSNNQLPIDFNGEMAAAGILNDMMVRELLTTDPFLQRVPPKSTGRELYGKEYFYQHVLQIADDYDVSGNDLVSTLTAYTAQSIAIAYETFLPQGVDRVIVGGGGTKNLTLMKMFGDAVDPAILTGCDDYGINSEAKEAIAFAILGYETLNHRPSNIKSATGAKREVILGSIVKPTAVR